MTYHSELTGNLVTFSDKHKCAEVVLVYKKKDGKDKNNYAPVSIWSNISKIYERCMH